MKIITSRKQLHAEITELKQVYLVGGKAPLIDFVNEKIFKYKVKFPVLEFIANELCVIVKPADKINIATKLAELNKISGSVVYGILLQSELDTSFDKTLTFSLNQIIKGNEWFVCDIIGERVLGVALLKFPEKTLKRFELLTKHESRWAIRSIGVAAHFAVKKGIGKKHVDVLFHQLLQLSNNNDFHVKKGIGWAVKTIAKFHPDIIMNNTSKISEANAEQWFHAKIKIGLGRSFKYASRYNS